MAQAQTGKRVVSVSRRIKRARSSASSPPIAPEPRKVTDGVFVGRLDPALLDMIRGHVETIRRYYPDVWDVPSWDEPFGHRGETAEALSHPDTFALYALAVGFICGCAAMANMTPCEFIDTLG